ADEARRSLQAFLATLPDRAAADVLLAGHTREDHDRLERLREAVRLALGAIPSGRRPLPFVEDIGIDPERLPAFLSEAITILKHYEVTSTIRVHVLTGQVHLRPLLDLSLEADAQKLWPLADRLHTLALDLGGTVSAQHGTGLARTPWVARQAGPLFPVFQELKRLFDPRNILNPGKIVGPDPSRPAWPLRSLPRPTRAPLLVWSAEEEARGVSSCNGCGACRADQPGIRMCPVFHALHTEAAAPRSKANLFRAFLDRSLTGASPDDLRQLADWCVNCRMCASECPSRVDVPKLMLETKAALHAAHGLKRSTWFLARLEGLASFASRFSLTTNFLLRRRSVRWLLEWLFGLSRRRTIPALAFRTFLGRARLRGWTRVGEDKTGVAYFVDTYANLFEPGLAEAAVAVLKHNGLRVHIPGRQTGSGAAALAQGDLDVARERLRANIRRLVPFAQAGATIVCSEPTAALFFRIDALHLADDPDVRTVAERTVELTAFLWELHQAGRLRTDFEPIEAVVAHHVPCHVKALGRGVHGSNLLGLIPGLHVDVLDVSCSGMAGAFGWNARNYPISLEAGKPMLQRFAQTQYQYGSSECSSCRIQMQQATGKRALHPVQYLALAYGLMPSIADRLKQPFTGLVSK
ncbi:MAG: FAD-linked oxidase C-terminal domain-containing protein, partial [Gemmataceae bacterium]|nr:FAD-linked oxidase C-terminal domain-containing protein [Gemmataceae bacterium]